jgi:RNA polymerase sigma factor (sigma-70 family)
MRDPLADPAPLVRRVYAYVAYRLGDGPDAEDVTSEVFERALRYRESYDPRKGDPVSWLIGIARRCVAGAALNAKPQEPNVHDVREEPDPAAPAVERLTVRAAVASLEERDRELITLRYGADLTARQIAEVLEMRTNAVEVGLHRALARLRVLLGETELEARQSAPPEAESGPVRICGPRRY